MGIVVLVFFMVPEWVNHSSSGLFPDWFKVRAATETSIKLQTHWSTTAQRWLTGWIALNLKLCVFIVKNMYFLDFYLIKSIFSFLRRELALLANAAIQNFFCFFIIFSLLPFTANWELFCMIRGGLGFIGVALIFKCTL